MTRLKPLYIVALGWIAFAIYAYPGLMTKDSFDQLAEARSGILSDAHPPMMAFIWRVLDHFVAGPFPFILLQTGTFIAGAYLVFRRVFVPQRAAIATVVLLWFPPVGAVMAVAWKDCIMAGFLMLGIALMFDDRRWVRLSSLFPLMLATAVRYNAFAATLAPIVILFTWRDLVGWRRYALSSAMWLATTLSAFGVSNLITDRPTHLWHSSLAVQDIVGTLHFTESDVSDSSLRRAFEGMPLRQRYGLHLWARTYYQPDSLLHIVIGPQALFDLSLEHSAPPDQRAAIERAWRTIVFGRFFAYLRHRVEVMRATIGLTGESWNRKLIITHDFQDPKALRDAGIGTGYSVFQAIVGDINEWVSTTPFFKPYVYLIVALALLVLAVRQRDVIALLMSGIVLEASLLFLSPSADYRYSHWMVVTTCIAIAVLFARRYREGNSAARPTTTEAVAVR